MKTILGIDPMDEGALVWIKPDGEMTCEDMPTVKISGTRKEVDVPTLLDLVRHSPLGTRAYIEKMQPMPKGGNANFKRGGYLYLFRAIFATLGMSFVEVPPKTWQKLFGIKSSKGNDTKAQSYLVATRLFPDLEFKTPRGRDLDGRCDAALIAEYGRKLEVGNGKN